MEGGYWNVTRALGVVTALLGVALLATSLAHGAGPLAIGVVLGVIFVLLGAGRVYLAGRSGSGRRGT